MSRFAPRADPFGSSKVFSIMRTSGESTPPGRTAAVQTSLEWITPAIAVAGIAVVLLTAAFFTKQSTMVFAAPLLLFHLLYHPRRFPLLLATSVVPCVIASGYLHWRTGGWFTYCIFTLPRQHAWVPPFQDTPIPDEYLYIGKEIESPEVFRPKSGAKEFVPIHLFVRHPPADF